MTTIELAYESFGETDSTPLLIIHGFLAASRNWRSMAKLLSAHHPVYTLDMRNHGNSPHAELLDYPSMAGDVLGFMDRQKLPKVHLLGHSMGGKVAMWFALHYPERVANLIVADISPTRYQHSFDALLQALQQLPLADIGNRKQAEAALADAIPDLAYRQFLLQNLLLKDGAYYWRIDLEIIQKNADHIVGFPDVGRAQFNRPVLFIGGEHSRYIQSEDIYRQFPEATITQIPNTSHWLYVEAPEAFHRLSNAWLQTHPH